LFPNIPIDPSGLRYKFNTTVKLIFENLPWFRFARIQVSVRVLMANKGHSFQY